MIERSFDVLPEMEELSLREWLAKPTYDLLVRVANSQIKDLMVTVISESLVAEGKPGKIESANLSLQKAQRFHTFLTVLEEIKELKTPIKITRLQ